MLTVDILWRYEIVRVSRWEDTDLSTPISWSFYQVSHEFEKPCMTKGTLLYLGLTSLAVHSCG